MPPPGPLAEFPEIVLELMLAVLSWKASIQIPPPRRPAELFEIVLDSIDSLVSLPKKARMPPPSPVADDVTFIEDRYVYRVCALGQIAHCCAQRDRRPKCGNLPLIAGHFFGGLVPAESHKPTTE